MHELFSFFVKNSKWFVFMIYVGISCALLFNSNPYQRHVYLTSANAATAAVYNVSNGIYSYFNLRDINHDLNLRNAALQTELLSLRQQLLAHDENAIADTINLKLPHDRYDFIVAHVISNSISKPYNFITLNKGRADGIEPEMGVIDQNGVVGIINVVGEHSSRAISLLNTNWRLSCKIKGSDNFGSLVWNGDDPEIALLEELPRHTVFTPGDTIITSGFSAVFPEGIPVGVVMADQKKQNENFFTLRIKLSTDFTTLSNVQVVVDKLKPELRELELHDSTINGE